MTTDPEIPREPTSDECNARAPLGGGWFALWYPQMGGYVGKAAVYVADPDGCFEAVIWHDGEFPFIGNDWPSRKPARIHHCDQQQFREFADGVDRCMDAWDQGIGPFANP